MILPTRSIKPIDSLFCIASYIIEEAKNKELTLDEIHKRLLKSYPKVITIETVILCINYLYIIGKLETQNEIIKIKL
jgi:hypothetical protein